MLLFALWRITREFGHSTATYYGMPKVVTFPNTPPQLLWILAHSSLSGGMFISIANRLEELQTMLSSLEASANSVSIKQRFCSAVNNHQTVRDESFQ